MVPTRENMLGITSMDDPIDTIRAATLKRKNIPNCKQYCNHEDNRKEVVNNPKF
jgi:hypothetical protein